MKKHILSLILLIVFRRLSQAQTAKQLRHFMQQSPSPEGAIPYGNNPEDGKYVQAGDAEIYYEVYGKGEPFVVLHGGLLGSTCEMHQFIDSLSQ